MACLKIAAVTPIIKTKLCSLSYPRCCLLCRTQSWLRRPSQWWMTKWPSRSLGSSWWLACPWLCSWVQGATGPSWLPQLRKTSCRAPNRSVRCGSFRCSCNDLAQWSCWTLPVPGNCRIELLHNIWLCFNDWIPFCFTFVLPQFWHMQHQGLRNLDITIWENNSSENLA